jgi:hypothetical protein
VRSESRHDDFRSEYIGIQEIVGFFEGFVSELEDVAAGFVALMRLIKSKKILRSGLPHRSLAPIFYINELPETMKSFGSEAKQLNESKVEVEHAVAWYRPSTGHLLAQRHFAPTPFSPREAPNSSQAAHMKGIQAY